MNFMNVIEYGIKKINDRKWETYAYTGDGKYLIPITWAREVHTTKREAIRFVGRLAKKYGWINKDK